MGHFFNKRRHQKEAMIKAKLYNSVQFFTSKEASFTIYLVELILIFIEIYFFCRMEPKYECLQVQPTLLIVLTYMYSSIFPNLKWAELQKSIIYKA